MGFARSKNRRRIDAERTTQELKATATRVGPLLAKMFLSIAATAAVGAGGWYGWQWARTSPVFALKQISVTGNQRASQPELVKLAGLSAGQNLFVLDTGAAERALRAHPWIKQAKVQRRLPSSLEVSVVEHVPVALVGLGELYLLDQSGEPFKRLQAGDGDDLPLVSGVTREEYAAQPQETAERFLRAIEAAGIYAASATGRQLALSEVRLAGQELSLVLADGAEVRLGAGDPAEAIGRLSRVRAELSRRGLVARTVHLDNRVRRGWVAVSAEPAGEKLSTLGSERRGSVQ